MYDCLPEADEFNPQPRCQAHNTAALRDRGVASKLDVTGAIEIVLLLSSGIVVTTSVEWAGRRQAVIVVTIRIGHGNRLGFCPLLSILIRRPSIGIKRTR